MRHTTWTIPAEAVRAMASGEGLEQLIRLESRPGLRLRPQANLVLGDETFFAEVAYEEVGYPGLEQHAAISLVIAVRENRPPAPIPASVRA